jgi:hypothetical protein
MSHTPLSPSRVIPDSDLAKKVAALLKTIPASSAEEHGITVHPKGRLPRALIFWGDFPPARDELANRIRDILGREKYEVSQCRSPKHWGKFRTATEEDHCDY